VVSVVELVSKRDIVIVQDKSSIVNTSAEVIKYVTIVVFVMELVSLLVIVIV
jgi:hypothetical protein